MELFELFGTIGLRGVDNVESQLDGVTGKAKGSSGAISSTFKKIGRAVATFFAVDKIKDFGVSIVNTAADVQAQTAQFEAAFGDYAGSAEAMFGRVSEATGVFSTRLQTTGTKAYSQLKGAGLDANTALEQTELFLNLASDAAAYYDISLEDAESRIRSFMRGNVEAGDAIGLFTSESQRNNYALETYGVKWLELTEAQKQMLMLNVVQDIYDQSGAVGQAGREMDGLVNITGNLKETWRQFLGAIGAPLLKNVVTPAIQKLIGFVEKLSEGVKVLTGEIDISNSSFAEFEPVITKVKDAFQWLKDTFSPIIEEIGSAIQENVPKWKESFEGFKDSFEAMKPLFEAVGAAIVIILAVVSGAITGIIQAFDGIIDTLAGVLEFVGGFFELFMGLCTSNSEMIQNGWQNLKDGTVKIFTGLWDALIGLITGFFDGVFSLLDGFIPGVKDNWEKLKEATVRLFTVMKENATKNFETLKNGVSKIVDNVKTKVSNVWNSIKTSTSNIFSGIKSTATSIWNGIKNAISKPIEEAKNLVKAGLDKIKGFFSSLNIKFPHIKLPHFSIKGKFSLDPPSVPSFGIDWYAKGGILTKPTAFGVNPKTGALRVGGEAGDEAVAPIDTLLGYVKSAVQEETSSMAYTLQRLIDMLSDYFLQILNNMDQNIILDDGTLVGRIAPKMNMHLNDIQVANARGR